MAEAIEGRAAALGQARPGVGHDLAHGRRGLDRDPRSPAQVVDRLRPGPVDPGGVVAPTADPTTHRSTEQDDGGDGDDQAEPDEHEDRWTRGFVVDRRAGRGRRRRFRIGDHRGRRHRRIVEVGPFLLERFGLGPAPLVGADVDGYPADAPGPDLDPRGEVVGLEGRRAGAVVPVADGDPGVVAQQAHEHRVPGDELLARYRPGRPGLGHDLLAVLALLVGRGPSGQHLEQVGEAHAAAGLVVHLEPGRVGQVAAQRLEASHVRRAVGVVLEGDRGPIDRQSAETVELGTPLRDEERPVARQGLGRGRGDLLVVGVGDAAGGPIGRPLHRSARQGDVAGGPVELHVRTDHLDRRSRHRQQRRPGLAQGDVEGHRRADARVVGDRWQRRRDAHAGARRGPGGAVVAVEDGDAEPGRRAGPLGPERQRARRFGCPGVDHGQGVADEDRIVVDDGAGVEPGGIGRPGRARGQPWGDERDEHQHRDGRGDASPGDAHRRSAATGCPGSIDVGDPGEDDDPRHEQDRQPGQLRRLRAIGSSSTGTAANATIGANGAIG